MNYMSNSILAYIPHKAKHKKAALKQILRFQKLLNMRIFILDILEKSSFLSLSFQQQKLEAIQTNAKQQLVVFLEKVIKKDMPDEFIPRIQMGETLTTLIKESKKGGYDFLALDKNESGLKKTNINKLISRSYCPVLLTSKDYPFKKVKNIIIPVDISQETRKKLLWATFFAKKFNARAIIVSALNINIDENKSLAKKNADKLKQMLVKRGVECDVKILKAHGQPNHKVILDYISEAKPELVMIRTHQESIFADSRIGQFVAEIVHGCHMPVFTVGHSVRTIPLDNV